MKNYTVSTSRRTDDLYCGDSKKLRVFSPEKEKRKGKAYFRAGGGRSKTALIRDISPDVKESKT